VALGRHLPALAGVEGVEVVALADPDAECLTRAARQRPRARGHRDHLALLAAGGLDAVAICVPTRAHAEVALAALEAGVHVLLEKPLALGVAEGARIAERAARSDRCVLLGFNLRWHPHVLRAREIVRSGRLGPLELLRTLFTSGSLFRGEPAWRRRRAEGGGVLVETAVHHLDLWRFVSGREIEEVFTASASEPEQGWDDVRAALAARLAGGLVASAALAQGSVESFELEVFGRAARLRLEGYRADGLRLFPGGRLVERPRGLARVLRSLRRAQDDLVLESFRAQWRHFAACARGEAHPQAGVADGLAALRAVAAAAQSAASGRAVRVAQAAEPPPAPLAQAE
jgi:predicted dehydrogenase